MKNRLKNVALVLTGIVLGATMFGGAAAYAAGVLADRSPCKVYVDGKQMELDAYLIDGSNYVKLRDIGKATDSFNVWWDGTVQIESGKPYTGVAPEKAEEDIDLSVNRELRNEVAASINKLRRANGLNELAIDDALMDAAQERVSVCVDTKSLSHDKVLSQTILLKYNYGHGGAAENIGWSSNTVKTADEIVAQFEASPGHLATMLLDGMEDVGVGVCAGDGLYIVMFIGNKNDY